ncbi:hypothetical protein BDW22DRAFT_963755 [Trametopsis cervina]|nr:hypothetical protein BDW22DRAFT_963755 [Trametopsis cervina]
MARSEAGVVYVIELCSMRGLSTLPALCHNPNRFPRSTTFVTISVSPTSLLSGLRSSTVFYCTPQRVIRRSFVSIPIHLPTHSVLSIVISSARYRRPFVRYRPRGNILPTLGPFPISPRPGSSELYLNASQTLRPLILRAVIGVDEERQRCCYRSDGFCHCKGASDSPLYACYILCRSEQLQNCTARRSPHWRPARCLSDSQHQPVARR